MATVTVAHNGMYIHNVVQHNPTYSANESFFTLGHAAASGRYGKEAKQPLGIQLSDKEVDAIKRANYSGIKTFSVAKKADSVNEDAVLAAVITDPITGKTYNFGAVADGLGGASGEAALAHRGSRLAVLAAFKVMNRLLSDADDPNHGIFRAAFERLVAGDEDANEALMAIIGADLSKEFVEAVKKDYVTMAEHGHILPSHFGYKVYGTTLSFTLLGPNGGISLQLGDGGVVATSDGKIEYRQGLDECDAPNTTSLGFEDAAFKAWVADEKSGLNLAPPRLTSSDKPKDMSFSAWAAYKRTVSPFTRAKLTRTKPGCAIIVATDGLEKLHDPDTETQAAMTMTVNAANAAENDDARAWFQAQLEALKIKGAGEIGDKTAADLLTLAQGDGAALNRDALKDDTTFVYVPLPKADPAPGPVADGPSAQPMRFDV